MARTKPPPRNGTLGDIIEQVAVREINPSVSRLPIPGHSAMQTLRGHLLIATPRLRSPIFARSVILMLDQNEEGALGVILNQPINTTMTDLAGKIFVADFEWSKPISLGGPVPSSLMVLHRDETLADHEIIPGVYFTAEASKVQELIQQRPEPSLVLANYSGWGPGQLDGELRGDSWLTLPATIDHVFWTRDKELWKVVVNEVHTRKLSELLRLRELPPDPTLN
jgi:putative transcriptional regulator